MIIVLGRASTLYAWCGALEHHSVQFGNHWIWGLLDLSRQCVTTTYSVLMPLVWPLRLKDLYVIFSTEGCFEKQRRLNLALVLKYMISLLFKKTSKLIQRTFLEFLQCHLKLVSPSSVEKYFTWQNYWFMHHGGNYHKYSSISQSHKYIKGWFEVKIMEFLCLSDKSGVKLGGIWGS